MFDGERFVVVADRSGTDGVRRVDSATVPRKDGTYVNKLTLRRVINVDAGLYICLCTNTAGYTFRRAYLAVFPRKYYNHTQLCIRSIADNFRKISGNITTAWKL